MQTQILNVSGMTCGGCVSSVTKVLQSVSGVDDVKVSLAAGQATVRYDEARTNPAQLSTAILNAGYGVKPTAADVGQPAKGGCCS